jgi:hypothetical protein
MAEMLGRAEVVDPQSYADSPPWHAWAADLILATAVAAAAPPCRGA